MSDVDSALRDARTLSSEHRYADAVAALEQVLDLEAPDAQLEQALASVREAAALEPVRQATDRLRTEGEVALHKGNPALAEELANRALDLDPENPEAVQLLDAALDANGRSSERPAEDIDEYATIFDIDTTPTPEQQALLERIDDHLKSLREALAERDSAVSDLVAEIDAAIEEKDLSEAKAVLEDAQSQFPDVEPVREAGERLAALVRGVEEGVKKARELLRKGDAEGALRRIEDVAERTPDDARLPELEAQARELLEKEREQARVRAAATELRTGVLAEIRHERFDRALALLGQAEESVLDASEAAQLEALVVDSKEVSGRIARVLGGGQLTIDQEGAGVLEELDKLAGRGIAFAEDYRPRLMGYPLEANAERPVDDPASPNPQLGPAAYLLGILVVVAAAIVGMYSAGEGRSPELPRGSTPEVPTGTLIVELSSPGRVYVGLEQPDVSSSDQRQHRFRNLRAATHVVKVCDVENRRCESHSLAVRTGENRVPIEVKW